MKHFFTLLILNALSVSALVARRKNPAPYITSDEVRHVHNLYRVRLQEGHSLEAHFEVIGIDLSQNTSFFYPMAALNSYHARLDPYIVHELVRYDPGVVSVLHDYYDDGEPRAIDGDEFEEPIKEEPKPSLMRRWFPQTISGAFWYNVMISAGTKLSTPLPEAGDRFLSSQAGLGVDIYILDSGINIRHSRFGGRASNFKGMGISPYTEPPETMFDLKYRNNDFHGTHVAGIAGADVFGAAPYANIINVKTHGQYGASATGVARAILDIIDEHNSKIAQFPDTYPGCVINMSFNLVDLDRDIQAALNKAYDAGILATVSAGNRPQPSTGTLCGYSVTVCVAATDGNYNAWYINSNAGSSYGPSVKIWAPGADIKSIYAPRDLVVKSGTSMATPMVAGVIAGFISHERLQNNPQAILNRLTSNQLSNIVGNLPDNTVNQFLNNGFGQTRNTDIPYLGAPERGWDVHNPNTNQGPTPVTVGDVKAASAVVQDDDTSSNGTADEPPSANTAWESIWYAESTTIVVVADLTTAYVEPLTSSADGDDGSFEGNFWDDTSQTTTGPAPADPGDVTSTAAPTSSSTGPTPCSGNQVEVSGCIPAAIASATAYSGVQPPACARADGDAGTLPRINATIAAQAAADYCAALISNGVVLTATESDTKPYTQAGVAENNSAMTLAVIFAVQACPTDQSMQQIDFKSLGQDECYLNMYTSISEVCAQDNTWANYNPDFTLEGGVFENDCALWSISAE